MSSRRSAFGKVAQAAAVKVPGHFLQQVALAVSGELGETADFPV